MEADFDETQVLIRLMVGYANMAAKKHALLNRIEIVTSEKGVFFWKNCPVATRTGPTILFPHLSLEFWHGSCCCRTISLRDPMKGGLVRRQVRADLTMETFTGMHTPGTPSSHRQREVPTGALPTAP
ncbi:hypothetical protein OUZ56_019961 [Daphnia magna]|uniref:Uncharacterized protein n=1 Tax=Daphnia magna TaxID=35525 RepID=A0ABQ9ZD42_9CRUS|nr:hypothetical protein OUZ56_019961 [Daphnia magna]